MKVRCSVDGLEKRVWEENLKPRNMRFVEKVGLISQWIRAPWQRSLIVSQAFFKWCS